jgi:hypothetical protein
MSIGYRGRVTPPMSAPTPSRRALTEESRGAHTLSVAVGVSLSAHAVAIGALLTLKPVPPFAPTLEAIEISLVPEQTLATPRANNLSGTIPQHGSAGVSQMLLLSLTRLDVRSRASSPDWSRIANTGRSFDFPTRPQFAPHTHAPAFDTLAIVLDCLAVGGSKRQASGHSRGAQTPCASDDPSLPAPVMALLPTYASRPSETGAANDYRNFKPSRSVFNESPLPDEVPQANRAFENWIVRLLQ